MSIETQLATIAEHRKQEDAQRPIEPVVSVCSLCLTDRWQRNELKHLDIFVHGSEGVLVCPDCDNSLTNHIRAIRSAASRAKAANFKRVER